MYILFLSVLFSFQIGNSCCSSENSVDGRVKGKPIPYDDWCQVNCDSLTSCKNKFGHNFIDLEVRNDFSISEETLLNGIFLGDTISKQSFETQFIFDISRALSISPCRLYVIDATFEEEGLSLNQDYIFVTFRLFPVDHDLILDLTKQVQDHTSKVYDGHVGTTLKAQTSFEIFSGDRDLTCFISCLLKLDHANNRLLLWSFRSKVGLFNQVILLHRNSRRGLYRL